MLPGQCRRKGSLGSLGPALLAKEGLLSSPESDGRFDQARACHSSGVLLGRKSFGLRWPGHFLFGLQLLQLRGHCLTQAHVSVAGGEQRPGCHAELHPSRRLLDIPADCCRGRAMG